MNQHTIDKWAPVAIGAAVVYLFWKARQSPATAPQAQAQAMTPAQAQVQSFKQGEFTPSPGVDEYTFAGSPTLRPVNVIH